MFQMARQSRTSLLLLTGMLAPALAAQQAGTAAVPVQIASAQKVFISNLGMNLPARMKINLTEDQTKRPYQQLHNGIKNWGRYQIVASPEEADLILEIQLRTETEQTNARLFAGELKMAILDAKAHVILWTLNERLSRLYTAKIFRKVEMAEVDKSMNQLIDNLKQIVG